MSGGKSPDIFSINRTYIFNIMKYHRIEPRDFFNEAKLLKCLGQLSLKILDGEVPRECNLRMEEDTDGQPYNIQMNEGGYLYVANRTFYCGQLILFLCTPYNSRKNYPLILLNNYEEIQVFTEDGEFTKKFSKVIENLTRIHSKTEAV